MINKFDFKDIVLVPETLTDIDSRRDVDTFNDEHFLPIMVSPMDTVVNLENSEVFSNCGMVTCFPRGIEPDEHNNNHFISMSLDDFENFIDYYTTDYYMANMPDLNILIDIANGHMKKLYHLVDKFMSIKKNWLGHKLMVGNIANPETYRQYAELGVDFIRVGIGGGSGCLTSANTGVHYPMASLINECYEIKKRGKYKSKIVADGGFRNYDEIIKAIALGADYVMLGGILNKTLESCGNNYLFKKIKIPQSLANYVWYHSPFLKKHLYKSFRGMSTKEVQKKWGREVLKTSEGISKFNKVEYTVPQWVNNFNDYLSSAMSYTNSINLDSFKQSHYIEITENAFKRFNK
jgi:putative N-acetylmannosamine-6-phosphate epimerase